MLKNIFSTASLFGIALGLLSVIVLINQGFRLGFAEPLRVIIVYYQSILEFFLGWADVPLRNAVIWLNEVIGIHLMLHSHWKHIFVLLWLYFSSDIRINLNLRRRPFAIFTFILGALIALVASVGTGAIAVQDREVSLLAVAFPVIGIFVFEIVRCAWGATFSIANPIFSFSDEVGNWWPRFFRRLAHYALPVAILGALTLVAAGAMKSGQIANDLVDPNLAALGGFIIALALFWILRGFWLGAFDTRGKNWREKLASSGMFHVGLLMLAVMVGTAIFLGLNAGLLLAGL